MPVVLKGKCSVCLYLQRSVLELQRAASVEQKPAAALETAETRVVLAVGSGWAPRPETSTP